LLRIAAKAFFFEKKKQKTFGWLSRFYPQRARQDAKFSFLFSKENGFHFLPYTSDPHIL